LTRLLPIKNGEGDVTEFKVSGEKLHRSPVMDLCNGEIIASATSKRPAFVLSAPC